VNIVLGKKIKPTRKNVYCSL